MLPRPKFHPFDEHQAVTVYDRNLPHWRQENATYFVTFRLADSLPKSVIGEWNHEKQIWLAAHNISYSNNTGIWTREFDQMLTHEQKLEFTRLFNRKLNDELDQSHGQCVFNNPKCLQILRDRLFEGDRKRYHLGDFIIMPNHVHLLLNTTRETGLDQVLQWIKGGAAFQCNRTLNRTGKLWQSESYDHLVRDSGQLRAFRKYIRENPEKANLKLSKDAYYEAKWLSPNP